MNLSNYESNYNTQSEAWNNEAVTFSENKTLTNKMINSSNNYSYGNEVEYIIYGNSNEKIKISVWNYFCYPVCLESAAGISGKLE